MSLLHPVYCVSTRPGQWGVLMKDISSWIIKCFAFCFLGLSIDDIDYDRYPCEEFQFDWIKVYLAMYLDIDHPTEPQIRKVYKEVQQMSLLSHFLWGIWSLVQYEHSDIDFDFVRWVSSIVLNREYVIHIKKNELLIFCFLFFRYAEIRLNRYYELRDKIFKQLSWLTVRIRCRLT